MDIKNVWIDRKMVGWMDKTNRWMVGWIEKIDGWLDGQKKQMDGWMKKKLMKKLMYRKIYGLLNGQNKTL